VIILVERLPTSTLGQWLQQKCQEEKLSLREAGKRASLSHSTIQSIINGGLSQLGHCFQRRVGKPGCTAQGKGEKAGRTLIRQFVNKNTHRKGGEISTKEVY